jgi:UDP-3-O-[3-hydroxymyristoyl] glucosamine N-acyltransferase
VGIIRVLTLAELVHELEARNIEVELLGDPTTVIKQVGSLDEARPDQITFFNDPRLKDKLMASQAGAIIVKSPIERLPIPNQLVVKDPYYVYAVVAQTLNPLPPIKPGIHPDAHVNSGADIDSTTQVSALVTVENDASIGGACLIAEGAYIGEGVKVGHHCRIGVNVVIMPGCQLGDHVTIEAGSVIGGDGFGWAPHQGRWEKIPQIGRVVIGNRVSIGNNVTIDRGALKDTVIGDDCIIDNLVHIAHNVHIGSGSAIAGQAGFAGSTSVGKHTIVAGQAGFAGHLKITDGCQFMAKSGVTHSIHQPGSYSGFPAIPTAEWQKTVVRTRQLDKMAKQLKALQKTVDQLQKALDKE